MTDPIDPLQYGMLIQKVETMEKEIHQLRQDMHKLLDLAAQGRGGFWAGMVFVSVASSLIGYIISLISSKGAS